MCHGDESFPFPGSGSCMQAHQAGKGGHHVSGEYRHAGQTETDRFRFRCRHGKGRNDRQDPSERLSLRTKEYRSDRRIRSEKDRYLNVPRLCDGNFLFDRDHCSGLKIRDIHPILKKGIQV